MAGNKFELKQGRWTKGKRPVDDLYYEIDFTAELERRGTTLQAVSTSARGVVITADAGIVGSRVIVKLGGLDVSDGAMNFCRFELLCANGEKFEAAMWFELAPG